MQKALRIEMWEYGGPSVLKAVSVDLPTPGVGEVIVEVRAAAINRADCEIRSGKWNIQRKYPFPTYPDWNWWG